MLFHYYSGSSQDRDGRICVYAVSNICSLQRSDLSPVCRCAAVIGNVNSIHLELTCFMGGNVVKTSCSDRAGRTFTSLMRRLRPASNVVKISTWLGGIRSETRAITHRTVVADVLGIVLTTVPRPDLTVNFTAFCSKAKNTWPFHKRGHDFQHTVRTGVVV